MAEVGEDVALVNGNKSGGEECVVPRLCDELHDDGNLGGVG